MVIAAWIALYKDDLKALLAFSTVSHLGLVTMPVRHGRADRRRGRGLPHPQPLHIQGRAVPLAGIVDHETGTRDARRLGGLLWLMPVTGTLAMVAAASMAGLPLLNGFSKEMMLEAAAHTEFLGLALLVPCWPPWGPCSAAYSSASSPPSSSTLRDDYPHPPHDPPPACGCR